MGFEPTHRFECSSSLSLDKTFSLFVLSHEDTCERLVDLARDVGDLVLQRKMAAREIDVNTISKRMTGNLKTFAHA